MDRQFTHPPDAMALPSLYRTFRRTTGDLPRTIELTTEKLPAQLGPHEVLVKMHAVSLNFRDIGMLTGRYPFEVLDRGIPVSDCAAEVIATGPQVSGFKIGDRVAPNFFENILVGDEQEAPRGLGGEAAGVLREYAVFEENILVHLPKHLSWEEVRVSSALLPGNERHHEATNTR